MPYDRKALFGVLVSAQKLQLPKAQAIARYALWRDAHYVERVECRRNRDGSETVILNLEIELAQVTVNPIQPIEPIGITVQPEDENYPEVVSLREDFPQVLHLNLRPPGPKSLCLYLEPYSDLKLHWTAHRFVERIRYWLAKTAENRLHPEDQFLEPLLTMGYGTLVVPEDLLSSAEAATDPYYVIADEPTVSRSVWLMVKPNSKRPLRKPPGHVALVFTCPTQTHSTLTSAPSNLKELDDFLTRVGFDFVAAVRSYFDRWKSNGVFPKLGKMHPILVFNLPKRRTAGSGIEHVENIAFLCGRNMEDLERSLENFRITQKHAGAVVILESITEAANITLLPFDVVLQFSSAMAARLNGVPEDARQFCLLGAGALGSQVFDTILRNGFGKWKVVDSDRLLPHNLARHHLTGHFVGSQKAEAICHVANDIFPDEVSMPIVADLLNVKEHQHLLNESLSVASAVLDCTASVPVARRLASGELPSKRTISLFLNPTASALVLLAEDQKRTCRLDWLEMQYYREIPKKPALRNHLSTTSKTRYSNACRSVTSNVPNENVALFAAIGSRAFREATYSEDAKISIWSLDASMQVERIDVCVEPLITREIGEWTVCTDCAVLHNASASRLLRLPNETGGVLLGSYDMQRRIIYVADLLPSPPDSEEWPNLYKRGSAGLANTVAAISERTLMNLDYIGEWHSHPTGTTVEQSGQDMLAMVEISIEMAKVGAPGLMLIVGDDGQHAFYVGKLGEEPGVKPAPRNGRSFRARPRRSTAFPGPAPSGGERQRGGP